jgi:hypothetical protein
MREVVREVSMLSEMGLGPKPNQATKVSTENQKIVPRPAVTKAAHQPKCRMDETDQSETKVADLRQFELYDNEAQDNWGRLIVVGRALGKIHDMFGEPKTASSLKAIHRSWGRYCTHRWKRSKQAINFLIAEAKVATHLKLEDDFPATRLRPLIGLALEHQAEAWRAALSAKREALPSAAEIRLAASRFKEPSVVVQWTLRSAQTNFTRDFQRALRRACCGANAEQADEFKKAVPELVEHCFTMMGLLAPPDNGEALDVRASDLTDPGPLTAPTTLREVGPKPKADSIPEATQKTNTIESGQPPVRAKRRRRMIRADGEVKAKALAEYVGGDRLNEIAIRYGISTTAISLWAKKAGLERRRQGCRVKVWPEPREMEIVAAVKAVSNGKPTLEQIGKPWKLSRAAVHRIYRKWRDWEPPVKFQRGDRIRFGRRDYEVVQPGRLQGKVRDLKANIEITIDWHTKGQTAVKL